MDSHSSRVSRVESGLLETINKSRSGLMNLEGIENREWRRNNRESSLHSRLDSLFSILDSREDRESSVNLLLNGTNVQMRRLPGPHQKRSRAIITLSFFNCLGLKWSLLLQLQ